MLIKIHGLSHAFHRQMTTVILSLDAPYAVVADDRLSIIRAGRSFSQINSVQIIKEKTPEIVVAMLGADAIVFTDIKQGDVISIGVILARYIGRDQIDHGVTLLKIVQHGLQMLKDRFLP